MLRRFAGLLAGVSAIAVAGPVVDRTAPTPVTNVSREQLESLPSARSVADLLQACPARAIPTVTRQPQTGQGNSPAINCIQPDDLRMIEVYKLHNQARLEVGSRPLLWDPLLATQAQSYGPELAQYGRPVHSSRVGRETSRENLLQALPGTSASAMVGVWTAEKRYFVNGIFPDVSRTGNWADVGHYSQMVWPTTTNLGCAIHTGGQFDWLICRYSPPGNKDGKMVLAEREKEAPLAPTDTRRIHDTPMAQPRGPAASAGGGLVANTATPQQAVKIIRCRTGSLPSPIGTYTYRTRVRPEGVTYAPGGNDAGSDTSGKSPPAAPSGPPPTGQSFWDDVYQIPDHIPVKADYDGTPATQPSGESKPAADHSPPPESILDDIDEAFSPPPESVLDDIDQDPECQPAPAKAGSETPKAAAAQGLSQADEKAVTDLLGEVGEVENDVAAVERDGWGNARYREDAARRLRQRLLEEKRFPPDSIRRWVERVDKVLGKLARGTAAP